jgi:hypothetical protein
LTTGSSIILDLDPLNFDAGEGIYAVTEYKLEYDGGSGNGIFVNLRMIPILENIEEPL